ncbi:MAG: MoaD/ThiS family protein [Saprospiraceae bacterium]|nr:MoaD/ThiS family protein [Saprospiraceae bacterium]
MEIIVLFFGHLTDITGESKLKIWDTKDTNELINLMSKKYPGINDMKYSIAINKVIIHENCILKDADVVALLPAFSGG